MRNSLRNFLKHVVVKVGVGCKRLLGRRVPEDEERNMGGRYSLVTGGCGQGVLPVVFRWANAVGRGGGERGGMQGAKGGGERPDFLSFLTISVVATTGDG
ncbi:unnamed protein product [Ilex paraguariensis]|uniref:Uncharacterized protein n=1 Tax=Ilex paraguariensis TaxID=185542 RepID=A0ABC8RV70_9AQUA